MSMIQKIEIDGKQVPFKVSAAIPRIYRIKFHRDIYKDLDALGKLSETGMRVLPISICSPLRCLRTSPTSWQSMQIPPSRTACICQDWDKKNFIFFCTYSIKPLLIFKVQNSLLLLTFSLLPIEEASSFFTTGFLYYSFCLLHCISDKVLTLKHNLYIFIVVNEHLINYV